MASGNPDDRSEINTRLTAIEQKLQQVPTREELYGHYATREELYAKFATRDELFANFAARDELILSTREENRRMHEETRRHFDVVAESLRDDMRLLAEGQSAIIARLDTSLAGRHAEPAGRNRPRV